MNLKLHRKYLKDRYTIGNLYLSENGKDVWLCNTIEDVVRDKNKDGDLNDLGEGKIMNQTAIPYGTYNVLLTISPRFKNTSWAKPYNGLVPLIENVKHFTGVRIHVGTDENSTSGCVIVGRNTIKGKLTQSRECYDLLMMNYLMPAHKRNEKITLTIV